MGRRRALSGGGARRVVAALLTAVSLVLIAPTPSASAHAYLEGSNPADGAAVAEAPRHLVLSFSEHVVLEATHIELVSGSGVHVPVTGLRLRSTDPEETEAPARIVADVPPLPHDSYRVSWETLSSDDLHRTAGVLVFGVGEPAAPREFTEPTPPPGEAGLRLLLLTGLALVLGGALAARVLRRAGRPAEAADVRRVARLGLAGAVGAAVVAPLLLADQLAPGGLGLADLLGRTYGARWLVREAGLLLLVAAAWAALRGQRTAVTRTLLVSGAVLACTGTALLGHAGAGTSLSVTRVAATGAHLAAALTWAGAVVCLVAALVAKASRTAGGPDTWRQVLRGFGIPAAACVSVMAVTGLLLASDAVGSVDAALATIYGRTLLVKLTLAGAAGALALVNHRRLRGGHIRAVPRRTVAAEAGFALAVVVATAVLSSAAPATEPAFVRSAAERPSQLLDRKVGDLQESLSLQPNRPGPGMAVVSVFDTRRPAPAPVTGVDVAVGGTAPTAAQSLADGRWSAGTTVAAAGPTTVTVTVHRQGLPDTTARYRWTVGGVAAGKHPVLVSQAPLRTPLRVAAGLLAVTLAGLWAVVLLRRRRRPGGGPGARDGGPRVRDPHLRALAPAGVGGAQDDGPASAPRHRVPAALRVARPHGILPLGLVLLLTLTGGAGAVRDAALSPPPPAPHPTDVAAPPASVTVVGSGPHLPGVPGPATTLGQPATSAASAAVLPGARMSRAATSAAAPTSSSVPAVLLAAYRSAVVGSPAGCHLPVTLLEAIGQVESGSLRGRAMDAEHRVRVLGPVLDGNGFAAIRDTDGGLWDGDTRWDRAVGPMQFIPSTWMRWARDGDGDGRADPQDVEDATAAAAAYLCAGGRDLGTAAGLRAAVLSYNHSQAYLALVTSWMDRFAGGVTPTSTALTALPPSAVRPTVAGPSRSEHASTGSGHRPHAHRPGDRPHQPAGTPDTPGTPGSRNHHDGPHQHAPEDSPGAGDGAEPGPSQPPACVPVATPLEPTGQTPDPSRADPAQADPAQADPSQADPAQTGQVPPADPVPPTVPTEPLPPVSPGDPGSADTPTGRPEDPAGCPQPPVESCSTGADQAPTGDPSTGVPDPGTAPGPVVPEAPHPAAGTPADPAAGCTTPTPAVLP